MQRTLTKRQRIIRVLTDPSTAFSRDPSSPPPASRFTEEKLASSKLTRSLFGTQHDIVTSRSPRKDSPRITEEELGQIPDVPTVSNDELFSSHMISPVELPLGYNIRSLRRNDYWNGYLDVLRSAGNRVGRVVQRAWAEQFDYMRQCSGTYYIIVITDEKNVIKAAGSLIVERKFINGLCKVGHIQDIAVAKDQKGKKLSIRVVDALEGMAKEIGCYKVETTSTEENEAFHEQCGLKKDAISMSKRLVEGRPDRQPYHAQ